MGGAKESSVSTPVAVDVCGSDSGWETIVDGALQAHQEFGIPCILVGNEPQIQDYLARSAAREEFDSLSVIHAPEEVTMDDKPSAVLRMKQQSSMRVAFRLLSDHTAGSVVSAGNTGAFMAAGLSACGTFEGIERPAIASSLPARGNGRQTLLLDSGANIQCSTEQLVQFALMGSCFVRIRSGKDKPTVGLLSNGTEASKGTTILREVADQLQLAGGMTFQGFAEGGDLFAGELDVAVCDGFVGNIVLKTLEGAAQMVAADVLSCCEQHSCGTAAPLKAMLKKKFNVASYGGAPLLGLRGVAMVCHGSSNSIAISNAMQLAWKLQTSGFVSQLEQELTGFRTQRKSDVPLGV